MARLRLSRPLIDQGDPQSVNDWFLLDTGFKGSLDPHRATSGYRNDLGKTALIGSAAVQMPEYG